MVETLIGLYKAEEIGPWRNIEDLEFATARVEWFDTRRLFTPICEIPPAEFEYIYYQQQTAVAVGAAVNEFALRNSWGDSMMNNHRT